MKRFQLFVHTCASLAILAPGLASAPNPGQAVQVETLALRPPIQLARPLAPQAPPATTFSQPGGFYTNTVTLSIAVTDTSTIRFTLDGSEPVSTSVAYTQALVLVNRSDEVNALANITTTGPGYWTPPNGKVFKGTVVRAAAFDNDGVRGPIKTQSYFISSDVFTRYAPLPIMSLATDPGNFFNPISDSVKGGIYVLGDNGANDTTYPFFNANFWQDWERPVNLEFYLPNGQLAFQQGAGTQVSGGYSRGHNIKSLNLYARSEYGSNNFAYQFFPGHSHSSYRRLVLRASGNDYDGAYMRDDVLTGLLEGSDLSYGVGRPVILFLNGEYWGIFHLRERTNQFYLADHFGVDRNKVDLLQYDNADFARGIPQPTVDAGSSASWDALLDYFATHEMTDTASYEYVKTEMNLDDFANYFAAQIYFNNRDWPGNNNRFWRTNDPVGKWRWLVWDVEYGYGRGENATVALPSYNMLKTALGLQSDFSNPERSTRMFSKLMANEDFRNRFIVRAADQMNFYFTAEKVNARIDLFTNQLGPLMPEHIFRWGYPIDMPKWQESVNGMRNFANGRVANYRQHIQDQFGLTGTFTLALSTDPAMGSVRTTSLDLSGTITSTQVAWNGVYFNNVPLQLSAVPKTGFRFEKWLITPTVSLATNQPLRPTEAFTNDLTVLTSQNVAYRAVFVSDTVPITITPPVTPTTPFTYNLTPWDLRTGPYTLTTWLSNTAAMTYPVSMAFRTVATTTATPDPGISATMDSLWTLPYSLTSRSRINGLDAQGIGFINTDNANTGAGFVGAAVLALNTTHQMTVSVAFTGGTVLSNTLVYAIRLQYRITNTGAFSDVLTNGNPVEYLRSDISGDAKAIGPINLPADALDKPYVELQWKYYCVSGCGGSGRRAQLRLDDISVVGQPKLIVDPLPGRRIWIPIVLK